MLIYSSFLYILYIACADLAAAVLASMITGRELSLFGGNMYKDQGYPDHQHQQYQQHSANQSSDEESDIFHFIQRILKRTQLSCTTLILALIYIDRFKARLATSLKRRTRLDQGPDYRHANYFDNPSSFLGDFAQSDRDISRSATTSCPSSNTQSPSSVTSTSTHQISHSLSDGNIPKRGPEPWSSISLFLVAVICADKYLFDATFSNAEWADFTRGQYTTQKLNDLERRFLGHLQYKLYVSEPEFDGFLSYLEVVLALKQVWGRGLVTFSYSDVRILTQQLMPAYAGRLHFKTLQGDMMAIVWQVMATLSRVYLAIVGTIIVAAAGYTAISELSALTMENSAGSSSVGDSPNFGYHSLFPPPPPVAPIHAITTKHFRCADAHKFISGLESHSGHESKSYYDNGRHHPGMARALAQSAVVQCAV
jgi:hypothetical protein